MQSIAYTTITITKRTTSVVNSIIFPGLRLGSSEAVGTNALMLLLGSVVDVKEGSATICCRLLAGALIVVVLALDGMLTSKTRLAPWLEYSSTIHDMM